eukprot:jgi/Bigna1/81762/fgenesh1_pg.83_\
MNGPKPKSSGVGPKPLPEGDIAIQKHLFVSFFSFSSLTRKEEEETHMVAKEREYVSEGNFCSDEPSRLFQFAGIPISCKGPQWRQDLRFKSLENPAACGCDPEVGVDQAQQTETSNGGVAVRSETPRTRLRDRRRSRPGPGRTPPKMPKLTDHFRTGPSGAKMPNLLTHFVPPACIQHTAAETELHHKCKHTLGGHDRPQAWQRAASLLPDKGPELERDTPGLVQVQPARGGTAWGREGALEGQRETPF